MMLSTGVLRSAVSTVAGMLLVFGGLAPAHAQIVLKPQGQSAMTLRTKSLDADVKISGQFATSKLQIVLQHEMHEQREVEFFYTVPPQTTVTYFAYWFRGEKVVARIVEKERAAAIYQRISNYQYPRDPALIELVGKRTFRARIFPVEANADLKIEMHMVQVLPADRQGIVYEFPLRSKEKGKGTIENFKFKVSVKEDAGITRVLNNYNLPVSHDSGEYQMEMAQSNYRAPMDLRVRLVRPPRALQTAMHAARSGGRDGFFALALTPDAALTNARIRVSGVNTYQVVAANHTGAKAHETLIVCGRYKGSGAATVTLTGNSGRASKRYQAPLTFSSRRENNNLATKLWAQRRIEQLGSAARHRDTVVQLSHRFSLPSKYSSWLAIPKAEREVYEIIKNDAEIDATARLLASEIADGRGRTRRTELLRKRLAELCRKPTSDWSGRQRDPKTALTDAFDTITKRVADQRAAEKYGAKPNAMRMAALQREVERLSRFTTVKAKDHLRAAEAELLDERIQKVGEQLAEEVLAGRDNAKRGQQLQSQMDNLNTTRQKLGQVNTPWNWTRGQVDLNRAYRAKAHEVASRLAQAQYNKDGTSGSEQIAAMESELERLSKKAGQPSKNFLQWEKMVVDWSAKNKNSWPPPTTNAREYYMRRGDPLISIDAPADAEQVVALMPGGETKRLVFDAHRGKWEARFDIPMHAAEGDYTITIIIVNKDGTRRTLTLRYQVDLTPPRGLAKGEVINEDKSSLRLQLDASEDTTRVFALLPWGEKLELKPSTTNEQSFFTIVPLPPTHRDKPLVVTYILTDKAHNRTTVTVDTTK